MVVDGLTRETEGPRNPRQTPSTGRIKGLRPLCPLSQQEGGSFTLLREWGGLSSGEGHLGQWRRKLCSDDTWGVGGGVEGREEGPGRDRVSSSLPPCYRHPKT